MSRLNLLLPAVVAIGLLLAAAACASIPGRRPAPPMRMTVCEQNTAHVCGTFTWTGDRYAAVWRDGATADVRVEAFTGRELRMVRVDSGLNQDFAARYAGTVRGRTARGVVVWKQHGRSWEGTWTAEW